MAEVENISNWNTNQVVSWFKGLDDALQVYVPNLLEAAISGAQLLALNYDDLDNLGVVLIGHQELILEGTNLLKQLHFHLDTENLQSHALNVNCRCRALRSTISSKRRNAGGTEVTSGAELKRGAPVSLIRLAADVLDASKILIMWLDRPPFMSRNDVKNVRGTVVNLSYELSITMQQTVFACVIEDAALSICKEMEVATNQLIVSNDPMTLQPSSLEQVHLINRDPSPGLGLFIKTTFEGYHVITGTKEGSISSRIRRIASGDEVVAVNGQTVVGWQLAKLVATLKNHPSDITITLKKRPHFSQHPSAMVPVVRRQQPERIPKVPPPISPIRKVADSRKNSSADLTDTPYSPARGSVSSLDNTTPQPTKMKHSKKKKKKKFTKAKAKSSGNISENVEKSRSKKGRYSQGSDVSTRPSSSQRNSMNSFASSHDSSLRSASSTEGVLSKSTGFLSKHADVRQSLELGLAANKNLAKGLVNARTQNQSPATKTVSANVPKSRHKSLDNISKHSNNNALKDVNSNQLKRESQRSKSQSQLLSSDKKDVNKSKCFDDKSVILDPASTPLDFLVIPPPPADPYTPRKEKLVMDLNISDSSAAPPSQSGSESPNSCLDTELRRRFTVIGSEASDDKWYEALLAEINANKAKRTDRPQRKRILGKLEESGASDDNVFFVAKLGGKDEGVVEHRRRKPNLRHRPVSMPPNYYSPLKLQQFRATQAVKAMNRKSNVNRSLTIIADENTSSSSTNISPIAHVDDNGVKKLAPLIYDIGKPEAVKQSDSERSWKSRSPTHRHSWYTSSATNTNNSNSSGNSSGRSKVPPKPPPRSSSVTVLTNKGNDINTVDGAPLAKSEGNMDRHSPLPFSSESLQSNEEVVGSPRSNSNKTNVQSSKPKEALKSYVGLLKLRNSPPPDEVTSKSMNTDAISGQLQVRPMSPKGETTRKLVVANELTKYWERKKGITNAKEESLSPRNNKTQPPVAHKQVPNLKTREYFSKEGNTEVKSNARALEQSKPNNRVHEQIEQSRQALVPPVAKPRTKVKSLSSLPPRNPLLPPPTDVLSLSAKEDGDAVDIPPCSSVKPYDNEQEENSEVFETSPAKAKIPPPVPPFKPRNTSMQHPQKKENQLGRIRSAQTSRGSYIAAIDVGYALQNYKRERECQAQEQTSHSVPQDTESYEIKHIGGVKVRIRKSPEKSRIVRIKGSDLNPDMRSQRRISCRDLGQGECDGWLWKKKSTTNSPLSSKWSKRWVVLKERALYCYRDPEDEKAESYIGLPGYQIAPAPECKRRFAFRVIHLKRKTFYFASDRQMDMSRWMNKMGLAAIEYSISKAGTADTTAKESGADEPTDDSLQYYSESDSEDAFAASAESSKHSSIAYDSTSPSSSPEKSLKTRAQTTVQSAPLRTSLEKEEVRHFSMPQSVLNKSARFQHKTVKTDISDTFRSELNNKLQDTVKVDEASRHRSKSEVAIGSKMIIKVENAIDADNQDIVSVSPGSSYSSHRKLPAVDAHQRRQKLSETKGGSSPVSASFDSLTLIFPIKEDQLKPARSMEEIHHLRSVAAKKAGEVAKKQTIMIERSQSFDGLERGAVRFSKNRRPQNFKSHSGVQGKLLTVDDHPAFVKRFTSYNSAPTSPVTSPESSKIIKNISRRDGAGRPCLKVKSSEISSPAQDKDSVNKDSSIDDLCKALQSAQVDIHGVNRRTTLRRKMTILSRDPKKNDLLLKKRVLQRQLKALQGELEYFNGLLDRPSVTSEELHAWINQHPALVVEMGTIRRMSKRKKKPVEEVFEQNTEEIQEENQAIGFSQLNRSNNNHLTEDRTSQTDANKPSPEQFAKQLNSEKSEDTEPTPLPKVRGSLADNEHSSLDRERASQNHSVSPPQIVEHKVEIPGGTLEASLDSLDSLIPKPRHVRPRSIAISSSSSPMRMRPISPTSQMMGSEGTPDNETKNVPIRSPPKKFTKPYLETDL